MKLGGITAAAAAAVVVLVAGGAETAHARQTTLLRAQHRILDFEQDRSWVSWVDARCARVRIRTLATGATWLVGTSRTIGCRPTGEELAQSGARVVFRLWDAAQDREEALWTGAVGERPRRLERYVQEEQLRGTFVTSTAGDRTTLVYGLATVSNTNRDECADGQPPCLYTVSGGGVRRVVGGRSAVVPEAPPAAFVSAARGRVAVVPADPSVREEAAVSAAPNGRVEIRDAESGAVVTRFEPRHVVRAIALSQTTATVLVENDRGSKWIERYDAASGRLLGARWVRPDVEPELDVAGDQLVYRRGLTIMGMDATTGRFRRLAIAEGPPVGLSIEGRRVAWAETMRTRRAVVHRVQALAISR